MSSGDTLLNALIGAVATVVLSFVPFSPVLGGAIAAYLEGGETNDGLRIGAISGAIASLPAIGVFLLLLAFVPFLAIPEPAFALAGGVLLLLVIGIGLAYFVVLSAIGGALGIYIHNEA